MNEQTYLILRLLEHADWFQNVGEKTKLSINVLSTWEEAVGSCASSHWQDIQLEARNAISVALMTKYRDRRNQWNTIAAQVRPIAIPLVERKVAFVMNANQLPKVFADSVQWDIIHIGIATEYADLIPDEIEFYAKQAYWYLNGHFPCGWKGNFPLGELIIY